MGSNRALAAGLGAVVVLLAAAALLSFRNTRELADDAAAVARGHAVLDALHDLQSALADAETGVRGYLAAADPGFLQPHDRAVREVPTKLDRLAELTRDDPAQQARLPGLRAAVDAKLAHAGRVI
ncbi:MAG: CHASE3 domain-containing protein, partial [Gemmataceae bacterium]|nr:CHASE3 domain-containing protein [Gemmataceae bacterium]